MATRSWSTRPRSRSLSLVEGDVCRWWVCLSHVSDQPFKFPGQATVRSEHLHRSLTDVQVHRLASTREWGTALRYCLGYVLGRGVLNRRGTEQPTEAALGATWTPRSSPCCRGGCSGSACRWSPSRRTCPTCCAYCCLRRQTHQEAISHLRCVWAKEKSAAHAVAHVRVTTLPFHCLSGWLP